MAEPTIDSATGGDKTIPPLAGEGSQTPPMPGKGMNPTPIGGVPPVSPAGKPGAPPLGGGAMGGLGGGGGAPPIGGAPMPKPKTPEQMAADQLATDSIGPLVEGTSEILNDALRETNAMVKNASVSKGIESLINRLLEQGWTKEALMGLIHKTKMEPKKFFKVLIEKIKSLGERGTTKFIKDMIQKVEQEEAQEDAITTPPPSVPPLGTGQAPLGKGMTPPPPMTGPETTAKASLTDVDLENKFNLRGAIMDRVIINNGTLEKVADTGSKVLENLVLAVRNTRVAINKVEDAKIRYAGAIALKRAADESFPPKKDEAPEDEDALGDESEMGEEDSGLEDLDDMGEEGSSEIDPAALEEAVSLLEQAAKALKGAIGGGEKDLMEAPDMGADMMGADSADKLTKEEGLMGIAASTLERANEVIKTAKKDMKALDDKKKGKGKGKAGDSKVMNVAMGGKSAGFPFKKKDDKDDKKKDDKKDDKKKDDKKDKEASDDTDDLIKRVKARLGQLRAEKEANLYPFNKDPYGSADMKVDNTNAETANAQYTAAGEIKGQPATDKKYPTINSELGQADLPFKQKGSSTSEKKVPVKQAPMKGASEEGVDPIKNAIAKSRLSVELAGMQQLKGLIDNPLRVAFVKNMVEVGLSKEAAEDIAYNSFIDGFEDSQKVIMKEAFETFVGKPSDDFLKVAQFTRDYTIKEANVLSSVDDEARDKTASSTPPLRGSSVDESKQVEYKNYWQDVNRHRRGF